jgi:prepilin peptidase CpaA
MAMSAVDAMRVAPAGPIATAERLRIAWEHASSVVRRASVLAAMSSVMVGAVAPLPSAVQVSTAAVGVSLVLAAFVDVYERRLPNRLLAAGAVALLAAAPFAGANGAVSMALGATLGGGLLLAVRLLRGIGMGDVKAGVLVGASVGVLSPAAAAFAIAVAAATAGAVGILARRHTLPLGPALWLGWAVALLATSMGWWT